MGFLGRSLFAFIFIFSAANKLMTFGDDGYADGVRNGRLRGDSFLRFCALKRPALSAILTGAPPWRT